MAFKKTTFSEEVATPVRGAVLLTDSAEKSTGFENYTVKNNFRRLTFDQEGTREGDVHFQPNQLVDSGSQAFPPITNGQPITAVHDVIFPNGLIYTIVATPTDIFAYVNVDGFTVYEIGPKIIGIDTGANAFVIKGDWSSEFVAGKSIRISNSDYNNGGFTITVAGSSYIGGFTDETHIPVDEPIATAIPDGVVVAPVYGNEITAVDTVGGSFSIDGNHATSFLDTNTFHVVGTSGNDGRYTVDGDSIFSGGKTIVSVIGQVPDPTIEGFLLPIYEAVPSWALLATGLEPGHRWEIFNNDFYVFFNNGVELPLTWQIGAATATPVHELREQGVAAVETITEYNGMILCADILEVPEDDLVDLLNGPDPYGVFDLADGGIRTRYKVLYSPIGEPRRWGVIVLGSIAISTDELTLQFIPKDWGVGTTITVPMGAGGAPVESAIISILGNIVTLADTATFAATDEAIFQSDDSTLGPLPGQSYELQDDNTGIVRMNVLKNTLVVQKDTAILIGRFNGNFENPLDFSAVYHGDNAVFWRWTVARVYDQKLVYASKDDFYEFDLSSLVPKIVSPPSFCRNLFFDSITLENAEEVYASSNELTDEIWFNFPDDALAYDYKYGTCSLVGRYYSGSKTILRPRESESRRSEERWFVGGRRDGVVVLYALTHEPQPAMGGQKEQFGYGGRYSNLFSMYQMGRTVYVDSSFFADTDVGSIIVWDSGETAIITSFVDGSTVLVDKFQEVPTGKAFIWESFYNAEIETGWENFKYPAFDKDIQSYAIDVSSNSGNPDVQIQLYANNNARGGDELVVDELMDDIVEYPYIPLYVRDRYFKEKIIITNQLERFIFTARAWGGKVIDNRRITDI